MAEPTPSSSPIHFSTCQSHSHTGHARSLHASVSYLQAAEHCVLTPEGAAGAHERMQVSSAAWHALFPVAALSSPILVCRAHAQIAGLTP